MTRPAGPSVHRMAVLIASLSALSVPGWAEGLPEVSQRRIAAQSMVAALGSGYAVPGAVLEVAATSGHGPTVVRLDQRLLGMRVIGADIAVRLDRDDRPRWIRGQVPAPLPDPFRLVPRLTAADVARRRSVSEDSLELVLYASDGVRRAKLAWAGTRETTGDREHVIVDAETGAVLERSSLIRRASKHRARVYDVSPAESELEEVVFDDLPEGARELADGRVSVVNCIDSRRCIDFKTTAGVARVHYCDLVATAVAGDDGSFLHVQPPAHDDDPEDSFAEVQAYHHIKKAQAFFEALDPAFDLPPLKVVVNMRPPDLSSEISHCTGSTAPSGSELIIEENAYFWASGTFGPVGLGNAVVLHQANLTDWAYDGEVVYHEYVHAVVHHFSDMAWFAHDDRGTHFNAGGIHEGLSDYFAGAMTGNAELSAYAGGDENGPIAMSTLDDERTCSDFLNGEEHDESFPFASALWAIRRSLRSQAKRAMMDAALLRVIPALRRDESFAGAVELITGELTLSASEFIESESLGAEEASSLLEIVGKARDKFAQRGLPGCSGRLVTMRPGEIRPYLQLKGPNTFGVAAFADQAIPAPVQFVLDVPRATTSIRLVADASGPLDPTFKTGSSLKQNPEMTLLLKPGSSPIAWDWDLPSGTHDASAEVALAMDEDGVVAGLLEGEFPAGRYMLQVTNVGEDWFLEDMHFGILVDGEFSDDKADGLGGGRDGRGGCSVGGRDETVSWLLGLCLVVALRRRGRVSAERAAHVVSTAHGQSRLGEARLECHQPGSARPLQGAPRHRYDQPAGQ